MSFIPMRAVTEETGEVILEDIQPYSKVKKGYTSFVDGDIIFAKITPCMENGKVAIVEKLENGIGFGSTEFHVIRLSKSVYRKFIFYFLIRKAFRSQAQKNMTGSAGQLRVPSNFLKGISIPLPPLPEQQRIVAKIEELFSELDVGVALLKRAKAQLRKYRQSVLKHAFEGKLTEAWRGDLLTAAAPPKPSYSTTSGQVALSYAAEKEVGYHYIGDIPKDWQFVKLGSILEEMQYGTSDKSNDTSEGIPVLRMGNIQAGNLVFENLKYFDQSYSELEKYLLQEGDILFNRTNSAELVGKTALYKHNHPKAIFASYLIRLKIKSGYSIPEYVSYYINSVFGRTYIKRVVSQNVGQANVNGTKLKNLNLPLPTYDEQIQIVQEIESRLSESDHLEKTIDQSLQRAELLRQSILNKAFSGKLVPQHPGDEPAETLLSRVQTAKESASKAVKKADQIAIDF